jgi:hypothetical protein
MRRVWFPQQKEWDYLPLRWGLGYNSDEEIRDILQEGNLIFGNGEFPICKKLYTTRKSPLKGEYYVVQGSRFKASALEPRIEFRVVSCCQLDLRNELVTTDGKTWATTKILDRNGRSFAELDLGNRGVTFENLRDELLKLYPKTTIDTPFFVSSLDTLLRNEVR